MNSIRTRLLVLILSGSCTSLVAGGLVLHAVSRARLVGQFKQGLLTQARTLAASIVVDAGEVELESSAAGGLPGIYSIVDAAGGRVAGAGEFAWENGPPPALRPGEVVWSAVELPGDTDGQAVSIRVVALPEEEPQQGGEPGEPAPVVTLTCVADRAPLDHALSAVAAAIVATGASVLVATAGLVWWGVRTGLRPLDRLADQMGRVRPDAIAPLRNEGERPSELRPVFDALDRLLARVAETIERERRFTDAAAHELRTPIAELRTTIDVARRWPEPQRLTTAVERADLITDRMARLIEALLLLGRNPADLATDGERMVDLWEAARSQAQQMGDAAAAAGISLTVRSQAPRDDSPWLVPEPVSTIGLRNLFDNALEYTPRGGEIAIEVATSPGGRTLRISNWPVSLTEPQLAQLFEPFWRAEASRSSRSHSGLGLSVVRHVCSGCGLDCTAEVQDGVLSFTLTERRDAGAAGGPGHA
ncbi:MAG: hypothetical protein IPJ41_04365 [Phycisphaerales bacterium]|nr:hypothetical protein [Phycisphaerales bacterium]